MERVAWDKPNSYILLSLVLQAAAVRQPGRAYAKLVASGLLADSITEQLAALGIDDASSGGSWVSGCTWPRGSVLGAGGRGGCVKCRRAWVGRACGLVACEMGWAVSRMDDTSSSASRVSNANGNQHRPVCD